jgi:hypothetical protein
MVLVLSVVDFPAVADRHDDDRGVILNEDHAPIADPKAATTAAGVAARARSPVEGLARMPAP